MLKLSGGSSNAIQTTLSKPKCGQFRQMCYIPFTVFADFIFQFASFIIIAGEMSFQINIETMNHLIYFLLSMVKFEESNDKSQLIFGSVTNIFAKDAAPVQVISASFLLIKKFQVICHQFLYYFCFQSIDTMAILENNGNLVLYTGVVRVSLHNPN